MSSRNQIVKQVMGMGPSKRSMRDSVAPVLVTGGAGFLGRHVCAALSSLGHRVTALDNLLSPNSTFECPQLKDQNIIPLKGSVFDQALIEKLVSEHPIIVHFATVVGVEETISNTISTIENIHGTLNIVRKLTPEHIILFGSSADVYGAHSHFYDRPMRESDFFVFEHGLVNRWVYPHVKALEENMISNSPARSVVIRVFNTYGPAMDYPAAKRVIPHFISSVLNERPLRLSLDGSQIRSFCYLDDMITGITKALAYARASRYPVSECFNLGNDEAITIRELAERLIEVSVELKLISKKLPISEYAFEYTQAFDDSWNRVPDIGRAREVLGYSPNCSLHDGLTKTLKYYAEIESRCSEERSSPRFLGNPGF